jgi:predicted dehydrogenase
MQLRYTTGLEIEELSANLEIFVKGRTIDDHFTAYCRLNNGARALVRATQIAIGHKNDLRLEINGTKGTLLWRQEAPEEVVIILNGQPDRTYFRGGVTPGDGFIPADIPASLLAEPTIPSGHPEGFHDAYARLHRCFEKDVRAYEAGTYKPADGSEYATVDDGWAGMAFIDAAIKSSQANAAWVKFPAKI